MFFPKIELLWRPEFVCWLLFGSSGLHFCHLAIGFFATSSSKSLTWIGFGRRYNKYQVFNHVFWPTLYINTICDPVWVKLSLLRCYLDQFQSANLSLIRCPPPGGHIANGDHWAEKDSYFRGVINKEILYDAINCIWKLANHLTDVGIGAKWVVATDSVSWLDWLWH